MGSEVSRTRVELSEDELVDLIMLSGYQLQIRKGHIDHRAVPLTKFVYSVAEDLGLDDVTRCWYLLGNFTVHPHASESFLLHLMGRQTIPGEPTANELVALSESKRASGIFAKISAVTKNYADYFEGETVELRRHIYKNKAPEQYRSLYLAHLEFTIACDNILDQYQFAPLDRKMEKKFSQRVFELQQALYATDLREQCRSIIIEHASLMEAMVISRCSKIKRVGDWYSDWHKEFKELDELYDNTAWKYPASQFAEETVVGPRAIEFKAKVRSYLATIDRYQDEHLPEIELRLSSKGLLPSLVEIEDSTGVSELKAEDREAIKDAFHIYLK